jgi:hypothetical protein
MRVEVADVLMIGGDIDTGTHFELFLMMKADFIVWFQFSVL